MKYSFLMLLAGLLMFAACKNTDTTTTKTVSSYDNQVAYEWNEVFLDVERYAAGYRPGPAPRALAYLGLSAYEACITGMPNYQSVANLYNGLSIPAPENAEYHWPTVINESYALLMGNFFPNAAANLKQEISDKAAKWRDAGQAEVSSEVFERSKKYGQDVATAVWEYSKTDAIGHDHYLNPFQGYVWEDHYKKDGDWKPTLPGPGKPMGGVWGGARTFAIGESEKLCRPPLPYSADPKSALYAQALEVYAQNTPTLSYQAEWVGEYWSDDLVNLTFSPGPRWLAIGEQVLAAEKSNLETALEMNVKMGMALNDASIACWKSKYYYNVERPQTYINRIIDANWKPALFNPLTGDSGITPSFPAYPSGHATMGGAGAEVLGGLFGYAYAMTDRCHENRTEFEGKPRSFGSFREMAEENGWSRIPLGVHFQMDSDEGVHLGTIVGRKVNAMPFKK